jgi:chemotaxis-related protein WspD
MSDLPFPAQAGNGCWKRIGVWGHEVPRCPVLEQVIHCRNCPIFTAAGRDVLNGAAPPGYLEDWTRTLAQASTTRSTQAESVIVFRVAEERLALPTGWMHVVMPMRPVHLLPHRSNSVLLGVTNVQGRLQVCLSMEGLLGLPAADRDAYRFLLVFGRQDERFGLPVVDVVGLTRYDKAAVNETRIGSHVRFVQGIVEFQGQPTGLLDPDAVSQALARALYR